eukprot:Nk52_evm89s745 gene=Nk52_evmTU89s745
MEGSSRNGRNMTIVTRGKLRRKSSEDSEVVGDGESEDESIGIISGGIVSSPTRRASSDREESLAGRASGIIYHKAMLLHQSKKAHPERPERLRSIWEAINEKGLLNRCVRLKARCATHSELSRVHTATHIAAIASSERIATERLVDSHQTQVDGSVHFSNDTYANPHTYLAAKYAAGCVIELTCHVIEEKVPNGIALVRPPGHHAEPSFEEECGAMGFCYFNNVAVAARTARVKYGLERILVVDWDVHHGNGIQESFYATDHVLYISIHKYMNGDFYPGTGDPESCGRGEGEGFNVNIGWNKSGYGDAEYLAAFNNIVLPIAYEYSPELVLVSAGFDACKDDPKGGMKVSPAGFAHMTSLLKPLANGKLVLALEGGYNLRQISECCCQCTKALLGDPLPILNQLSPQKEALDQLRSVGRIQCQYWNCMDIFREDTTLECLADEFKNQMKEPIITASTLLPSPSASPNRRTRYNSYNDVDEDDIVMIE